MRYTKYILILIITLSIALVGCTSGTQKQEEPNQGNEQEVGEKEDSEEQCKIEIVDLEENQRLYRNECLGIEFEFNDMGEQIVLMSEKSNHLVGNSIPKGKTPYVYIRELKNDFDDIESFIDNRIELIKNDPFRLADNIIGYIESDVMTNKNKVQIYSIKSQRENLQKGGTKYEHIEHFISSSNNNIIKISIINPDLGEYVLENLRYID